MSSNLPARRSRRQVARLEGEVHQALELAQANAAIQAGQQVARIRAAGRVAQAGMAEVAHINEAEAQYAYGVDEYAQRRVRVLADTAAWTITGITREMGWR